MPELVVASRFERVSVVWLTATDDLISERILDSSQYDQRADGEKHLIKAFLERSLAFNEMLVKRVHQLGQRSLNVSSEDTFDKLLLACERPLGLT